MSTSRPSTSVLVRHNFETAHRLPILPGKCENLHGHSWWVEVTVTAPGSPLTVVEFGAFKKSLRTWIDSHLDHGVMLGVEDPLAAILPDFGKVFVFGTDNGERSSYRWPSVEAVAHLLAVVAQNLLHGIEQAPGAEVTEVVVSETHVNKARWTK